MLPGPGDMANRPRAAGLGRWPGAWVATRARRPPSTAQPDARQRPRVARARIMKERGVKACMGESFRWRSRRSDVEAAGRLWVITDRAAAARACPGP